MHQFVLVITACAILIFGDMVYSEPLVGAYSERVEMIDVGRGDVKVYVPSTYNGKKTLPLIIALHGFTGSSDNLNKYWKLAYQVDIKNFILCMPDGTRDSQGRSFWNATPACCDTEEIGVDDSGYLLSLITALEKKYSIDSKSIHIAGYSNGGFMALRMAHEHSEKIASVASLAGATHGDDEECNGKGNVHVLQIHGTRDEIVKYDGGSWKSSKHPFHDNAYTSAFKTTEHAAFLNKCHMVPIQLGAIDLDRLVPGNDTTALRFENVNNNAAVAELWTMHGAPHGPAFNSSYAPRLVDWLLQHRKVEAVVPQQQE